MKPKTWVRVVNAILAMAVVAVVLGNYARAVKAVELERASLGLEAEWIGGHAKQIKSVTPGGPADRAGLRAGDVLRFGPNRESDWVLVGYRNMPEGFSAPLPVRHADGSTSTVTLVPDSVAYLPTLND
ncbi:MAG: hypothetical protein FIB04_12085, partial [Gammaproteobacteria bacterium]|nr:hypothetical protein [Gammaproteobacteria bacterium]